MNNWYLFFFKYYYESLIATDFWPLKRMNAVWFLYWDHVWILFKLWNDAINYFTARSDFNRSLFYSYRWFSHILSWDFDDPTYWYISQDLKGYSPIGFPGKTYCHISLSISNLASFYFVYFFLGGFRRH